MAKGPDSSSDQEAPVVEVSHSPNVTNGKAIAKLKTGYGKDPAADKSAKFNNSTLTEGGPIDLWELKNIGFIMQYFAIGFIYYALPATTYGVMLGYLVVPGYVYMSVIVVTGLPWSFKFGFGMLNDCVPIFGYRRKPYMVLGWAFCCAMFVYLYFHKLPDPYYCQTESGSLIREIKGTKAEPCNPRPEKWAVSMQC
jgi:hypothetical protein